MSLILRQHAIDTATIINVLRFCFSVFVLNVSFWRLLYSFRVCLFYICVWVVSLV